VRFYFEDLPPEWDIKLNTGWKITKLRDYFPDPKRIPEQGFSRHCASRDAKSPACSSSLCPSV